MKKVISAVFVVLVVGVALAAWQIASAADPGAVESTPSMVVESYRASSSYTPDGVSTLGNQRAVGTSRLAMFTPDGVSFVPVVVARSVAPGRPTLPSYIGSGAYTPDGVSSLDRPANAGRLGSFTPDGVSWIRVPRADDGREGYKFVDVGAWDDTNIEWNVSHSLAEPRSTDFMDVEQELGHQYADAVIRGQSAAIGSSDLHRVGNWYEDEFAAAQSKKVDFVDVEQELGHQFFDAVTPSEFSGTKPSDLHRVGNWYEDEFAATR